MNSRITMKSKNKGEEKNEIKWTEMKYNVDEHITNKEGGKMNKKFESQQQFEKNTSKIYKKNNNIK